MWEGEWDGISSGDATAKASAHQWYRDEDRRAIATDAPGQDKAPFGDASAAPRRGLSHFQQRVYPLIIGLVDSAGGATNGHSVRLTLPGGGSIFAPLFHRPSERIA